MMDSTIRPDSAGYESKGFAKDDIRSYEETFGQYGSVYIDEPVKDSNLRHYKGPSGDCVYDPTQFQLQIVEKKDDQYGGAHQIEVLRYIGSETDGRKIHIPEGLTDTSFMFYGSNVKSVPKIPEGVESAFAMFSECHSLKDGRVSFPASLKETEFMFANSENMLHGPKVIPGTVKNADYMFTGCAAMQNTPIACNGVQSMNGTYALCASLKDTPVIPKSVRQAANATYGCSGMDMARDAKEKSDRIAARAKFEEKLDRPSFGARVGSMFSALLQVHAMRKMGYGIVMAPLMTYQMRKAGNFGRDFNSGLAVLGMQHGGVAGRMLYNVSSEASAKNAEKQAMRRQEKLAQWDRLYGEGTDFNKKMQGQAARGAQDAKNGLFNRIFNMETSERQIYRESHGKARVYKAQEELLRENFGMSMGSVAETKSVAKWYKDQLADKVAYYVEAKNELNRNPSLSKAQRDRSLVGLDDFRKEAFGPLVDSMHSVQRDYHLFNDGDVRDINKMFRSVYGKDLFEDEGLQKGKESVDKRYSFVPAPESSGKEETVKREGSSSYDAQRSGSIRPGSSERIYGEKPISDQGHKERALPVLPSGLSDGHADMDFGL